MKGKKPVLGGREQVKVAVIQTAPAFLDKEGCIEKACRLIVQAGKEGAELIVFTEAWIPTYPFWGEGWESGLDDWVKVRVRFQDNAVVIPSEDTDRLGEAARKAGAYVVVGVNEMDPRPESRTIYNCLLYLDPEGRVMGRHRKLMPTFIERVFWGWGDARDLVVFDTDIGRIGGLICGEHLMTLVRAAMIAKGEEFHIAVYPGTFSLHCGPRLEELDKEGLFWGHSSVRAHALESGSFVVCGCGYISPEDIPDEFPYKKQMNIDYAQGGSSVIAPLGIPLVGPEYGDRILYADCPAFMIKAWKSIVDTMGHYSRPDVVELVVKGEQGPRREEGLWDAVGRIPYSRLKEAAERHEVEVSKVEKIIEELVGGC